jgi:hypothetical protein
LIHYRLKTCSEEVGDTSIILEEYPRGYIGQQEQHDLEIKNVKRFFIGFYETLPVPHPPNFWSKGLAFKMPDQWTYLGKGKRNEIHTDKKLALREFCAEPDNIQALKLLSDPKKRKANGN